MQTRNVLFLLVAVVVAAACGDTHLPEPGIQAQERRIVARAERRLMASQHEVVPLDEVSLASATEMAASLDIPAGMVTGAELTSPGAEAAMVLPNFGVIGPRRGSSLLVMSTGRINVSHLPEPGTDYSPIGIDNDAVTLRITVNVPRGANRLSFEYNFLSAESPDYVGTEFNDKFTARVTDAQGTRIAAEASVNSSFFFDASATRAGGTGFDLLVADDPFGLDVFPGSYPPGIQLFPDAGITDFKRVNVPVAGGGTVTLEFDIRDLGDGVLDSTVVLDNISFSGIMAVDPNPALINQFLGTVVTDPARLAVGGEPVSAVAADGATQILLRAKVDGPGHMDFSLEPANAPADGGLSEVGATGRNNSIRVNVQEVSPGQYYAFALYRSPEDFVTGDEEARTRTVSIAAHYTPTNGVGFDDLYDITIVRPPVVVVHDIWSGCLYWEGSAGISSEARFDVTCADYSRTNWASLNSAENKVVVPETVNEALQELRGRGVAVTQVDTIAHGMGGLLVRRFTDWPNYRRFSNFNEGDLNRLITMNTPHVGARLADEIVEMRQALITGGNLNRWMTVRNSLLRVGIIIDGPGDVAIDDLRTDSAVINAIGETGVPSHLLVSQGGLSLNRDQSFPMLLDGIRTLYQQMERWHPLVSNIQDATERQKLILGQESMLFCDDQHDLFVAVDDQKGGVNSLTAITDGFTVDPLVLDTEHFKVPSDVPHTTKLVDLLNSPIQSGLFTPSIPPPQGVPRVNSCNGGGIAPARAKSVGGFNRAQSPLQGRLSIASPSAGTPVSPGGHVTVILEATGGFQPEIVFVTGVGRAVFLNASPLVAEFPIPAEAIGTIELMAFGIDAEGEMVASDPVVLPVASSAALTSIDVLNGDAILRGPGAVRPLVVLGHYDDGITRDITAPGLGTVYSSSNTGIATVTSDGTVTGRGPGIATIVVRNGTVFTSINVTVGDGSFGRCINVRLGDYNLFVLEDYAQGHDVQGRVAAGGNISLQNFSIGGALPETDTANVLVAGGDVTLASGGVWGDVRYGGQLVSDGSVDIVRGAAAQGTPIDFAAREQALRGLSASLAALPTHGTTTIEPWGGVMLRGTSARVNVFEVDGTAFSGATLLFIEAPANSLAVINVRGTSATFSNFGQSFSGGIDARGVLFNFPDATSLTASGYGFLGTVLAPKAHVLFNQGSWDGGLYARSLTGNAAGHLNPLRDTDICL
jgi:choice-of-anchor A domain-containing protein